MFKTTLKFLVLCALLLSNMAIFTWCIDKLELGQTSLDKNLINNVEAKTAPIMKIVSNHQTGSMKITENTSFNLHPSAPVRERFLQKIVLPFKFLDAELTHSEKKKFQATLKQMNINNSFKIEVFSGPTPTKKKHKLSVQTSKLRAQTVAKMIYPYNPDIKMFYRPNLEEDTVLVQLSQN